MADRLVVVLKGYPRLSETFIAQELLGLERRGMRLAIVALRRPADDGKRHPVHRRNRGPSPLSARIPPSRAAGACCGRGGRRGGSPGYRPARRAFLADFSRDRTRNRARRFGQALVLAAEMPQGASWLHAHFLHTPASVTAYASLLTGLGWTCSAHAKDIWTTPEWELREKLAASRWVVTCTRVGAERLRHLAPSPDRVQLSYHGIDLSRFPSPPRQPAARDGAEPADPVIILSVGRAVAKKGFDVLLHALAALPGRLAWRFIHVGGGELLGDLRELGRHAGYRCASGVAGSLAPDRGAGALPGGRPVRARQPNCRRRRSRRAAERHSRGREPTARDRLHDAAGHHRVRARRRQRHRGRARRPGGAGGGPRTRHRRFRPARQAWRGRRERRSLALRPSRQHSFSFARSSPIRA